MSTLVGCQHQYAALEMRQQGELAGLGSVKRDADSYLAPLTIGLLAYGVRLHHPMLGAPGMLLPLAPDHYAVTVGAVHSAPLVRERPEGVRV